MLINLKGGSFFEIYLRNYDTLYISPSPSNATKMRSNSSMKRKRHHRATRRKTPWHHRSITVDRGSKIEREARRIPWNPPFHYQVPSSLSKRWILIASHARSSRPTINCILEPTTFARKTLTCASDAVYRNETLWSGLPRKSSLRVDDHQPSWTKLVQTRRSRDGGVAGQRGGTTSTERVNSYGQLRPKH